MSVFRGKKGLSFKFIEAFSLERSYFLVHVFFQRGLFSYLNVSERSVSYSFWRSFIHPPPLPKPPLLIFFSFFSFFFVFFFFGGGGGVG